MQFLTTTTESYISLFFTLALMLVWSPSRRTPLFWRPVPTV